jgi:hypothetical protein
MSDMVECRSGEVIAAEINGIKRQVEKTVRGIMLTGAMEIGCLLIEAKAVVPHGEWGAWLETNVDYSQTTANDLMRLYTEYKDGQVSLEGGPTNEELFGALAPSKALALLALPKEERREYVQTHDVEDMSYRQLKEDLARVNAEKEAAQAAAKAADAERAAAEILANEASDRAEALVQEAEEKRKEAEAKLANMEKRRDEAVKVAVAAEREKLQKDLKKTRENLEKALAREKEQEKQIDLLKQQAEEAAAEAENEPEEESPEVAELKAQVERLEKALRAADPAFQKFGALLEQWQGTFYDLVGISYAEENTESGEKMRAILRRVLEGFAGEIKGDADNG